MMQIVYFSGKDQFLRECHNTGKKWLFIAPSPTKADGLRSQLKGALDADVITIAKFTTDLLSTLWDERDRPQVKRKAELLLIFGILKKKYFPQLGFEQFLQAYNLFSDLRSFTLDEGALASVLEEQSPDIKQAVSLFWKLLQLTGYCDEHAAYHAIAEALRGGEEREELKKTFVFWGFQHLNGQQVDLLKALAIRYDVIVPFPLLLKSKLKRSDWPSWLMGTGTEERELPLESKESRGHWVPINSREIALHLKLEMKAKDQIVLGVSKLKPQHIDLLPSGRVRFKVPHELLHMELVELDKSVPPLSLTDLKLWLEEQKKIALTLKKSPFKKLKAIQLYEEAIAVMEELTDEAIEIDSFFKKLLREVVALNQPRTSFVPLLKEEADIDLHDLSHLEDIDPARRVVLCLDERFDEVLSLSQGQPESIQKVLAALGPLKRNELELHFKQWEFEDLFSRTQVQVLMPEGILKHSLVWKRLFSGIQLEKVEVSPSVERRPSDYFGTLSKKKYEGSFSASRFQTYLDCPRKFYYSYVEKMFPDLVLEKDIDPLTSGTIIHAVIEEFFKTGKDLSQLPALVSKIFQQELKMKGLNLPADVYEQRSLVFNHRANNGIQFLSELEKNVGESIQWTIEDSFQFDEPYKLSGKIDCLGVSANHIFLLDFKSSKAAASSNADVESAESLQLWVYALATQRKIPNFDQKSVVIGYVVLDGPDESNLLFSDDDLFSKIKSAKFCRPKSFELPFNESLKNAEEKMQILVTSMRADTNFPARPRKAQTCDFCELLKVCVKSEARNV